jgi:hypothetical protein
VIVTDEMTRGAQRIMNETFDFLRLPRVDVGAKSRFCVRGKAGVMDVLHRSAPARGGLVSPIFHRRCRGTITTTKFFHGRPQALD